MRFCRLFFLVLLLFISRAVSAATFIVSSNADAGAGTLRQALLDATANGTQVIDNITFNLPLNATTITLQTQLPDVPPNVIIDGTTQPGPFLGVSNAKVTITPAVAAANFNGLNISGLVAPTDVVQLYGLNISGFSTGQTGLGNGIVTNANCNLTIGAPGKGNVISGNNYALVGYFQNTTIQSNFIGVQPDGVTPLNNLSVLYTGVDYNNLLIGGNAQPDGNVILGGVQSGINFGGATGNTTVKKVTIQNNYFNTNYTGTASISGANNSCVLVADSYATLNVTGNVFSAAEVGVAAANQSTIIVKGNYFGTDKTQNFQLGSGTQAIDEENGVNATIGGTTAADQNVFTNFQNPILALNNCVTNVIQNSFYCNASVQLNDPSGVNFVRITTFSATTVAGDAPPGATVQLYFTGVKCNTCNPNQWFATVTANGAGKWTYNGVVSQNVLASSTVNNNTYGFIIDPLTQSEVTIVNNDCHHPGSITLNEPRIGNFQITWTDSQGNVVGNGNSATNLMGGTYTVVINESGTCPSVTSNFTLTDLTPKVFSSTFQLNCNQPTGYFTAFPSVAPGFTITNYYWQDASGKIISTTNKVTDLAAGNYTLYITDSNGCNSAKATFQVLPAVATPMVDDSKAIEMDATCSLPNGSVTGIVLTNAANANYGWNRADGTQFSFGQLDLTNAPAGQYYFSVNYSFSCPPIKSKIFTINDKGVITMDETAAAITGATCSNNNGAVKGIAVTGATQFQWFNANGIIVGNGANLLNVPAGSYYLVASNAICSKQSQVYAVTNTPAVNNYPSTLVSKDAFCNLPNGGLDVTFGPSALPVSYRWANAAGTTLISNAALTNQPAGNYQLFVTDNNGCESLYKTYTINEVPALQIVPASALVSNDQCGSSTGSIININISGGIPPYTFAWLNAAKQTISTNINLVNVAAGKYTLLVKDASNCATTMQTYTVVNDVNIIPVPTADNLQICSAGNVLIMVKNTQPGFGYRLYDNNTTKIILQDQTSGAFTVQVAQNRSYFVTQYAGNCESPRIEVKIIIGASNVVIPNTFTPNGDGINDYWNLKGLEEYPYAVVQIFDRYGQRVFESKGYGSPFNGTFGGSLLPTGVYYYIVNLNSNCNLLSGSLTLIR